jgi:hypothetical protein
MIESTVKTSTALNWHLHWTVLPTQPTRLHAKTGRTLY